MPFSISDFYRLVVFSACLTIFQINGEREAYADLSDPANQAAEQCGLCLTQTLPDLLFRSTGDVSSSMATANSLCSAAVQIDSGAGEFDSTSEQFDCQVAIAEDPACSNCHPTASSICQSFIPSLEFCGRLADAVCPPCPIAADPNCEYLMRVIDEANAAYKQATQDLLGLPEKATEIQRRIDSVDTNPETRKKYVTEKAEIEAKILQLTKDKALADELWSVASSAYKNQGCGDVRV